MRKKRTRYNKSNSIIDKSYIEDLFSTPNNFFSFVREIKIKKLPITKTDVGTIIGGSEFYIEALEKFNRRTGRESLVSKRIDDVKFNSLGIMYKRVKMRMAE